MMNAFVFLFPGLSNTRRIGEFSIHHYQTLWLTVLKDLKKEKKRTFIVNTTGQHQGIGCQHLQCNAQYGNRMDLDHVVKRFS